MRLLHVEDVSGFYEFRSQTKPLPVQADIARILQHQG